MQAAIGSAVLLKLKDSGILYPNETFAHTHTQNDVEFVIQLQLYKDGGIHPMYGSHLSTKG